MQEVRHDGSKGNITEFDQEKLTRMLEKDNVSHVEVFIPKIGQIVQVENMYYRVTSVSRKGALSLRPVVTTE